MKINIEHIKAAIAVAESSTSRAALIQNLGLIAGSNDLVLISFLAEQIANLSAPEPNAVKLFQGASR
jgi:hypothetical protein